MSSELFEALNLLEKERGIQVDFMVDKITKAILTACKNSYDNEDARVEVNPDKGAFDVYLRKEVVDEVFEPNKEISLEDAQKIDPNATYEDKVDLCPHPDSGTRCPPDTCNPCMSHGPHRNTAAADGKYSPHQ